MRWLIQKKVLTALYNLDFENRSQFFLLLTGWTVFQKKWCLLLFFVGKREVAEFGPMAGIAGAALAIAVWCHQQLKYGFHWKKLMNQSLGSALSKKCKQVLLIIFKMMFVIRPNEMFPSVTPYMSEDDMLNHLKSQLQLIANERGMSTM